MPIEVAKLMLTECGAELVQGIKHRLGCLPDGRRLDAFVGGKGGRIVLRVRESQGPKRFYVVDDLRS